MRGGRRLLPAEPIAKLRLHCMEGLERLPQRYRRIDRSAVYPVRYTKRLEAMLEKIRRRVRRQASK
jgi:hypothetical protein